MAEQTNTQIPVTQAETVANAGENISGRGVFVIETVAVGVSVRTAFLAEDGRLLDMPAVFPDMMYAMAQIDELRQHVARRFAEAAQIGSQVIAQQLESNRAQAQATDAGNANASALGAPKQVETVSAKDKATNESPKESAKGSKAVAA